MIESWLLSAGKFKKGVSMEENKDKKENSQAPDYLELMRVLTEMGYEITKFENVTPEPKGYEIPCETYELRIVHCL